ncbi:protein translocase subunit SecF [Candidatus Kaiserbacteria bacterium]|nr:MAG: protein translocase subunit SecF [Candidatus Kaiserbacteria bacterium]
MNIKQNQSLLFILPAFFSLVSIVAILMWGLKPGIDLAGGSMLQVSYENRPALEEVNTKLAELNYGEIRVQASGDNDFMLRQRELKNEEKEALMGALNTFGTATEVQFNSVGPSIGAEIVEKSWWAIVLVSLSIITFIAFAFRHVSEPVSSWKYGVIAIVTLLHDILIPTGLFAYPWIRAGAEVGVFFIVAILTTLGISINDTIVVFDRIRENLHLNVQNRKKEIFGDVVWRSIMQTMARSINTSVTVVIMLVALFVWGQSLLRTSHSPLLLVWWRVPILQCSSQAHSSSMLKSGKRKS